MADPTVVRTSWLTDRRKRLSGGRARQTQHNKAFYMLLAAPGIIWLALLFLVPFYDVVAIAAGHLNFLTESPVAIYNPLSWSHANLVDTWRDIFGATAFELPIIWRTIQGTSTSAIARLPVTRPSRSTVMKSPMRISSSSRWEI